MWMILLNSLSGLTVWKLWPVPTIAVSSLTPLWLWPDCSCSHEMAPRIER